MELHATVCGGEEEQMRLVIARVGCRLGLNTAAGASHEGYRVLSGLARCLSRAHVHGCVQRAAAVVAPRADGPWQRAACGSSQGWH